MPQAMRYGLYINTIGKQLCGMEMSKVIHTQLWISKCIKEFPCITTDGCRRDEGLLAPKEYVWAFFWYLIDNL